MKFFIILIVAMIVSLQSECQELLHKKIKDINEYINERKGKLVAKRFTLDIQINIHGDMYVYEFPVGDLDRNEPYFAMFFFSKEDGCIHYLFRYHTGDNIPYFVDKFNDRASGFMMGSQKLEWISKTNHNIIISIKKSNILNDPTNFEIDYLERPKNRSDKSALDDSLEKYLPGLRKD